MTKAQRDDLKRRRLIQKHQQLIVQLRKHGIDDLQSLENDVNIAEENKHNNDVIGFPTNDERAFNVAIQLQTTDEVSGDHMEQTQNQNNSLTSSPMIGITSSCVMTAKQRTIKNKK